MLSLGSGGRYGEPVGASGSGTTHKFTGKERDSESGLDYFGARYYISLSGRFLTPDLPFIDQRPGNPQSWNLYHYARNNPLAFTDPTGNAASCAVRQGFSVCTPMETGGGLNSIGLSGNGGAVSIAALMFDLFGILEGAEAPGRVAHPSLGARMAG